MKVVIRGVLFFLVFSIAGHSDAQQDFTQFVNPFIGTSNYGATHPGPVMPQGLSSVVPFNVAFKKGEENTFEKDSEWHSRPYVFENRFLTGFSHINLSGVGCPDLGMVLTMPTGGELELDPEKYGTTYSNEVAEIGYYANQLDRSSIRTEMTATTRCGLSRYHFPAGKHNLIVNLGLALTNETGASIKIVAPGELHGTKMFGTFCYNPEDVRPLYFVVKVDTVSEDYGLWKKMPKFQGVEGNWTKYNNKYKPYPQFAHELMGEDIGAYFTYDFAKPTTVSVKVGMSLVSIENAKENLDAEVPAYDFENVRSQSKKAWNDLLSRIEIDTDQRDDKVIFYTALFHTLLHPSVINDVNGEYPKMGNRGVGKLENGAKRYTVFSLWDTYRNLHPFLSLVYPELQLDYVNSMIGMAEENGALPKWELMGMETNVMVGDPASPVIADTYLRGIEDFDVERAYHFMRKSAIDLYENNNRPGIYEYDSLGYIPENGRDSVWGTVSTTLEYNISDWNIGQLAQKLGKEEDYQFFDRRSQSYLAYLDPKTKMLRPKMVDGSWLTPFDPEAGKNFEPVIGFVEGNAWQYRFYVPHDIHNLIDKIGGVEEFEKALDLCFETDNYDMANEPDITYPYLYNYVPNGRKKASEKVEELVRKYYHNTPAGIPGNDDTGTLSAWLLYSMMGFYPDCPGNMDYTITQPLVDKVTIRLSDKYYGNNKIEIQRKKPGFNTQVKWCGKKLDIPFISHHELIKGGKFVFK